MRYETPGCDDRDVWNVYLSPMWTAAAYAAHELDLFTSLERQPGSADEIAARLGLNPRGLRAVLPLLACLGFLVQRGGRYQPTEVGRTYLTRGSPFSWGPIWEKKRRRSPDADFVIAALKAKPGDAQAEMRPWEAPAMTAQMAQTVADTMNAHSLPAALGVARHFPFEGLRRLLDVGGGGGCYAIVFAQQHPNLHCTVLDLPQMCEVVERNVEAGEVNGRVATAAVDMFREAWPCGHDAIFLSNVLHDWDDAGCADLLARAYEALPAGGQVLLHEMLFDDSGGGPLMAASFSVLMLGTQGRQRTYAELAALLTAAGFVDPAVRTTSTFFSVVSARKP